MAHINQVLFNLFEFEIEKKNEKRAREKNKCVVKFFMYNRFYVSNKAASHRKKDAFQS